MLKAEILLDWFKGKESAAVAFSGGVDSAVVAAAARRVLGEKAVAVTARSSTISEKELEAAMRVAGEIGIEHVVIDEDEMDDPRFAANPVNRCYYCREGLVKAIRRLADSRGIKYVLDGANADDPGEHRPGLLALREGGALSPLLELGFGKSDVREIAAGFGLSVSDKPSMACLASRIPYGEPITKEKLRMVERAEDYLRTLGFSQLRVRNHGGIARIEVELGEFEKAVEKREIITKKLRELGFNYVTLDLVGYRSGSMDEVL
ncbi:MAG TPA: ATP-dependent sacrificial sulfur transferase LarE [Euryarchaeota archaeon]|nr:tRNA-specific 2-thiouridylase MnmA [archaeon BMS3Bbin16]HDH28637.1 ATP-dependent sacrificial sulfur transferase LarE [Euryarchaeota archaeon]